MIPPLPFQQPHQIILSIFIFSNLNPTLAVNSTCYYPDGSIAPDDVPCFPSTDETFCCPSDYTCMTNPGPLCQNPNPPVGAPSSYTRGSCNVPNWESSACPLFCLAQPANASYAIQCQTEAANGDFCCGYDYDSGACNCDNYTSTWPLFAYSPIEVAPSQAVTTASLVGTPSFTTSGAVSTTALSLTAVSTIVANGTAAVTSSAQETGAPAAGSGSSGMTEGSKIGLGVGITAGMIALAAMAWMIWKWRRPRGSVGDGAIGGIREPYENISGASWVPRPPPTPVEAAVGEEVGQMYELPVYTSIVCK